jgi:outer membrane protein TolC
MACKPYRPGGSRLLQFLWTGAGLALCVAAHGAGQALTLETAIELAQRHDPWLEGSRFRQQALEAQGIASGSYPDPMLSVGFANLPTDSFDFDQEPMTQFRVGVIQTIPRGDSLALRRRQLEQLGSRQPYRRADRRAQVAVTVSDLWLDSWRAQESIRLIRQDRALFEQLVDVVESRYSSALGATRQQDLVRAQLELTRLDDRLARLAEQLEISRSALREWLAPGLPAAPVTPATPPLPRELPRLALTQAALLAPGRGPTAQQLHQHLLAHPALRDIDTRIAASDTGIRLTEQKYRPEWQLNASYGYREDAPDGSDRADFFSVGVTVDLPLFTANRQDKQLQSAIAGTEAIRTERALLLRQLTAGFEAQRARLLRLEQRRELYRSRLLAEMQQQAEASLTAYTNDDGDFAEVMRARIDGLNARIETLEIEVERLKTIARLNYYFAGSEAAEEQTHE